MRKFGFLGAALLGAGSTFLIGQIVQPANANMPSSRIDKQLFCHEGDVYNSDGLKVSQGQGIANCTRRISGALFCHEGDVYNSDGDKISPGTGIANCALRIQGSTSSEP